jgi:hypothetical protein
VIPLFLDPDAPFALHGISPEPQLPIKNKLTWTSTPSIVLNDPLDDPDDTYKVEDISISPVWDEVIEPNVDRDGALAAVPREVQKVISIRGFIHAPSLAKLYDKMTALNRAFNPVLSDFQLLKFAQTTTDTDSWPTGYILQQYVGRSIELPVPVTTKYDDHNARFEILIRSVDPAKYEQVEQEATRTGNGNLTLDNLLATYGSWPTITIDTTASPAAGEYVITRDGTSQAIRIDGDAVPASETITIDVENRTAVDSSGDSVIGILKPSTQFFQVRPAEDDIWSVSGMAAGTDITIAWRRAFV